MHNEHPNVRPADAAVELLHLPPHSLPAEMCLLGALMLSGDDVALWARVTEAVDAASFFQADHRTIFVALADLRRRRRAIDGVTLCDTLADRGELEDVGGRAYVGQILNAVPSAAHGDHYAAIVRGKARRRDAIRLANDAQRAAYEAFDDDELDAALAKVSRGVSQLMTVGRAREVHQLGDLCGRAYDDRDKSVELIPTGIETLDRMFGGLPIGGNTLVGGKPSHGKSAIIKQALLNIAGRGVPVGLITVEETGGKVAVNMLSNRSGVVNARLAYHTATPGEWDRVRAVLPELGGMPFHVVDSASTLTAIVAMAERLAVEQGCKVIAVDHLHIVNGEQQRGESREQVVGRISSTLKTLWKQLRVAGVGACQLNRGSGDDRPTMANLRDSGTLEQDGDTIVLVHREDVRRKQTGEGDLDGLAEAIVVKNKTGGCGTAVLRMDEARQRITDRPLADPFGVPAYGAAADAAAAFGIGEEN